MLNISEIAQAARRPESGAEVVQVHDPAEVACEVGDVRVHFQLDQLDPSAPRWTYAVHDDRQAVATGVVAGAGGVVQVLLDARQLAGLPAPAVGPVPSQLTFGEERS
jgi:hypothetical protein